MAQFSHSCMCQMSALLYKHRPKKNYQNRLLKGGWWHMAQAAPQALGLQSHHYCGPENNRVAARMTGSSFKIKDKKEKEKDKTTLRL